MERMERVPRTVGGRMSGVAGGQAGFGAGAMVARSETDSVSVASDWDIIDVPASAVEALRGEVVTLRERLAKAAPKRAVEEMDRAVSLLHRQMQSLSGAQDETVSAIAEVVSGEVAGLRAELSAVRTSERFAALDAGVAALGRRIETLAARAVDPAELMRLEAQSGELKALVAQALSGDALKGLADRIAACADAVARAGEAGSRRLAGAAGTLERNAQLLLERTQELEASMAASGRAAFGGLHDDLKALHTRLDTVSAQIAARAETDAGSDAAGATQQLSAVVERHLMALTARFREAHERLGRLDGIDQRLGRLDGIEAKLRRLDGIEAALERLGGDLHRSYDTYAAAAEETIEALALKLTTEAGSPAVVALKRGLAALEARQDDLERRTEGAFSDEIELELHDIASALRRTEAGVWAAGAEPPATYAGDPVAPEVSADHRPAGAEPNLNQPRRRAERAPRATDLSDDEAEDHHRAQQAGPQAAAGPGRRVDWDGARNGRPQLHRRKRSPMEALRRRAGLILLLTGAAAIFTTTAAGLAFSSASGLVAKFSARVTPAPDDLPAPVGTAALQAAARAGDLAAAYEVGARYADGRGVAADTGAAVKWLGFAVSQGFVPAAFRLGGLYENTAGDPAEARRFYEWAAENGNVRAMHNLAVLYSRGHFARADGTPDWDKAVSWFRRAAETGHRDSQYNLGVIHARGLAGAGDMEAAWTWFAIAARQGDEDSARKRDALAERLDPAALARARKAADSFAPKPLDPKANTVIARPEWDGAAPSDQVASRPVSLAGKVVASRYATAGQ